jgi:hypothetical protein
MGWASFWAFFFTNSSGHPGLYQKLLGTLSPIPVGQKWRHHRREDFGCGAGLPDGIFTYQKYQILVNLGKPGNWKFRNLSGPFGILFGHLFYFMPFWYIFVWFVMFPSFWYIAWRKIWQPCCGGPASIIRRAEVCPRVSCGMSRDARRRRQQQQIQQK